jgi:hypothetical protein
MHPVEDIPLDGLEEVLQGWSGRGQLYEALATIPGSNADIRWQHQDIEGRAHRIMLARLGPLLEAWPTSAADWLHALPAQSLRLRRISDTPQTGTDWVETRMLGWPPEQFVVKDRSRVADQLMSTTLRWTLDQLAVIRRNAVRVERSLRELAATHVEAALSLRNQPPLDATAGMRPVRSDVEALRRSGWPWTKLAPVTDMLITTQSEDLLTFARQHLLPDDDIRWRLFHLAVLGMLLKTLRERGAAITSLRPLSGAASAGPAYAVQLDGRRWDLWFEAAAIWRYYGQESPYQLLTRPALGYQSTPLGADILLIIPEEDAYAFECKYGETSYIARDGYLQAVAYGHELRMYHARNVSSCVVGPDSRVGHDRWLAWNDVTIGIIGPRHIQTLELLQKLNVRGLLVARSVV